MPFVRTIVAALMPSYPVFGAAQHRQLLCDLAGFVAAQVQRAPGHLRFALWAGALALGCLLALFGGTGRGSGLAPWTSLAAIGLFERLAAPCAQIVRFFRSMTVLAFFEHGAVIAACALPDPTDRQRVFRARRHALIARQEAR